MVAAPADAPPLVRMQGATYATAIAEHFRDRGQHVLLLMDSLTRYAMAQREIALAIGEPPATKGYPPSCFAKLPQLVERSGNGLNGARLDHRVLHRAQRRRRPAGSDRRRGARHSRRPHRAVARARRGRPLPGDRHRALDLARDEQRWCRANRSMPRARARQLLAKFNKARDLIQLGAYAAGRDAEL